MTIDKAILILDDLALNDDVNFVPDDVDALKLGIEALKRLQEHRSEHIDITFRALPGEA